MGFLSKAWKGIKGAVKRVAKNVKKVAKGVVTSTPFGQKIWKEGGRLGKKVMGAIGKISGKLGPIGMMALSFVLAPVIGPALGSLWSSFGAGAASMAASGNAIASALGSLGQGIYAAGNFVGGTLGAMGDAISQGASKVMEGQFSAGAKAFASNMSSAFSGEAGMAAVSQGATAAAAAGASSTQAALSSGVTTADTALPWENLGQQSQITGGIEKIDILTGGNAGGASASAVGNYTAAVQDYGMSGAAAQEFANQSTTDQIATIDAQAKAQKDAVREAGKKVTSSLLGGDEGQGGFQMPQVSGGGSVGQPLTSAVGGTGSSGFSLLQGVQGLEQSVRHSQGLMFR